MKFVFVHELDPKSPGGVSCRSANHFEGGNTVSSPRVPRCTAPAINSCFVGLCLHVQQQRGKQRHLGGHHGQCIVFCREQWRREGVPHPTTVAGANGRARVGHTHTHTHIQRGKRRARVFYKGWPLAIDVRQSASRNRPQPHRSGWHAREC